MSREKRLQAKCVIAFSHKYPEQRGRLIGYFAETESKKQGGVKNSLGLVRSVSDLLYVRSAQQLIGIELKDKGSQHDRLHLISQARWLMSVPSQGWFCDSVELFLDIVEGKPGIPPLRVMERCLALSTETVSWDAVSR